MNLSSPVITALALDGLRSSEPRLDPAQRALFQTIDGRRNVVELESVARALGLQPNALERFRAAGLIRFESAAD